ncbi:oxidoreductase [Fusarium oxysporum f. sp. phaseoli]
MALSAGAKDAPNLDASHKNVSPKSHTARQTSKQQIRHRASVACASCRDRRIRCVVLGNPTECTACSKSGTECIIKNDDERRRPISKAYISHTAEAVAAVLSLPEAELAKYKNKAVYTPSFHLTQREILDAVQCATGTTDADWDIKTRDVNEVAREYEDKISQGDGVAPFIKFFVKHFLEGHGGDFNHKADSTELEKLEQLGLHKEDLVQAIKVTLQ